MTYSATKFEVAMSNCLRRYIYKKIHYLTFDLGVKVKQNVAQYPLHHVTYSTTKFENATPNGLGGDIFTRNVTDGQTYLQDRRSDVPNGPWPGLEKSTCRLAMASALCCRTSRNFDCFQF